MTLSGKIYKRHFAGSMKSAQVVAMLKYLQHHVSGPLILIWDRASIPKSWETRRYLDAHPEIRIESLPAYAPELNPEEQRHENVKAHLKNATPGSVGEIRTLVDRGFARLRQRQDLLYHFVRHAGLVVKQL